MKATRRHELKSNELAQFLEDARDFFSKYGNYFVGGLVVIALIVLGYVYMTRSAEQALADATREMRSLPFATDDEVRDSVGKLIRVASENEDQVFIPETLRRRASMAMNRAQAADDGTPSAEFLEMARAAYQEVIERYPGRSLDVAAALIGLATIEEDFFILDDDLAHKDACRGFLEQIRDNAELNGTPFQTVALERLNALDRTFVQVVMVDAPPVAVTLPGGTEGLSVNPGTLPTAGGDTAGITTPANPGGTAPDEGATKSSAAPSPAADAADAEAADPPPADSPEDTATEPEEPREEEPE